MTKHFTPEPTVPAAPFHLVDEINHRIVNAYAEAISSLNLAAAGSASGEARSTLAKAPPVCGPMPRATAPSWPPPPRGW